MLLVLDSSILCQDLRFTGTAAQVLFGNVRVVPVVVAVPEVVVDEVTNHFRERLAKARLTLTEAHKKLSVLVPESADLPDPANIEQETVKYRQFLLQELSAVQGRTLLYPTISSKDRQKGAAAPKTVQGERLWLPRFIDLGITT